MNHHICFIGSGNLASAIIKGLKTSPVKLHIASPNVFSRHQQTEHHRLYTNNCDAIKTADIIILAVKPHQISEVLDEIAPHLTPAQKIVSLAAGTTIASIEKRLKQKHDVFRAMPNIAASINESTTALFSHCQDEVTRTTITELFNLVGTITWLEEESQIDIATIIAGSSPAFLYLFLESLLEAGVSHGLSKDSAEELIKQASLGALKLVKNSDKSFAELISQVTSKKGTTEAGLDVFTQSGFKGIVKQSFNSALSRAKELSNQSL